MKITVTDIYAPTEEDLRGICTYCGEYVMDCYNKNYCGNCGKKITWDINIQRKGDNK